MERYRAKYDKQVQNNEQIELEIAELKKEIHDLNQKYEYAEMSFRQEKERNNKLVNEMHLIQKELKEWKARH